MNSRLVAAAALALAALLTSGCTAEPEPAPSPSPLFATEEEAYAAAEETYRAYVDALNQVDLSDPETFEDVYAWTTGAINADDRESFSRMHADEWTVRGDSTIKRVDNLVVSESLDSVQLGACLDVSDVTLTDSSGESKVGSDRPDVQSTLVSLTRGDSATGFLIDDIQGADLETRC